MQKLPQGGSVIIATDNDPAGKKYVETIKGIAEIAQRDDLGIIDHRPETEGQDWNNALKAATPDNTPQFSRWDSPTGAPRMKP
jgi:hypothetical protein